MSSWVALTSIPFSIKGFPQVISFEDNIIYLGVSSGDDIFNKVYDYNIQTGLWNNLSIPDIPLETEGFQSIVKDGKLFIFGGKISGLIRDKIWRLDLSDISNGWIEVGRLLQPLLNFRISNLNRNEVIITGGEDENGNISQLCSIFDITQDSTRKISDLPVPLTGHSITSTFDGRIFIYGGSTNATISTIRREYSTVLYQYDHIQDIWNELSRTQIPLYFDEYNSKWITPVRDSIDYNRSVSGGVLLSNNEKLFFVGGGGDPTFDGFYSNSIKEYSLTDNTWGIIVDEPTISFHSNVQSYLRYSSLPVTLNENGKIYFLDISSPQPDGISIFELDVNSPYDLIDYSDLTQAEYVDDCWVIDIPQYDLEDFLDADGISNNQMNYIARRTLCLRDDLNRVSRILNNVENSLGRVDRFHRDIDFNLVGDSLGFGTLNSSSDVIHINRLLELNPILIYKGIPSKYLSLDSIDKIVEQVSKEFESVVFNNGYQKLNNLHYNDTKNIVKRLRNYGTKVYGIVSIGGDLGDNTTIPQIYEDITSWNTLGVDGIYLEQFGFEYNTPRIKQIISLNKIRDLGLIPIIDSAEFEYYACDNISQLNWDVSDPRYIKFESMNPENTPILRYQSDIFLIKDFGFNSEGIISSQEVYSRVSNVVEMNQTTKCRIYVYTILPERVLQKSREIDYSKTGYNNKSQISQYLSRILETFHEHIQGWGSSGSSFDKDGGWSENVRFKDLLNIVASDGKVNKITTTMPEFLRVNGYISGRMPDIPHTKRGNLNFFAEMYETSPTLGRLAPVYDRSCGNPLPSNVCYSGLYSSDGIVQYGASIGEFEPYHWDENLNRYISDPLFQEDPLFASENEEELQISKESIELEDIHSLEPYNTPFKILIDGISINTGFYQMVELESNRRYNITFDAKIPDGISLIVDRIRNAGKYFTYVWQSNNIGTGKVETYSLNIITGNLLDNGVYYNDNFSYDGSVNATGDFDGVRINSSVIFRLNTEEKTNMELFKWNIFDLDNSNQYLNIASKLKFNPVNKAGDTIYGKLKIPDLSTNNGLESIHLGYMDEVLSELSEFYHSIALELNDIERRIIFSESTLRFEREKLTNQLEQINSLDIESCCRNSRPPLPPTTQEILDWLEDNNGGSCGDGTLPEIVANRSGDRADHISFSYTCTKNGWAKLSGHNSTDWFQVMTNDIVDFRNIHYYGNRYSCGMGLFINGNLIRDFGRDSIMCWDGFGTYTSSLTISSCPVKVYDRTVYDGTSSIQPITSCNYTCSENGLYRIILEGQDRVRDLGWIELNQGSTITGENPYYRGNRYDCGVIIRVNGNVVIDTGASSFMCWDSFSTQVLSITKVVI